MTSLPQPTPQEKLERFLADNKITLGLVLVSKNGSTITLLDAIKPDYLGWQASIVVNNGNADN